MAVQVDIVSAKQHGSVTLYDIEVRDGDQRWTILKRYSEFLKLDRDLLVERSGGHNGLTREELPSKGMMGFRHRFNIGSFNTDRQAALERYLKNLAGQVSTVKQDPTLEAFLAETDASIVGLASAASTPDLGVPNGGQTEQKAALQGRSSSSSALRGPQDVGAFKARSAPERSQLGYQAQAPHADEAAEPAVPISDPGRVEGEDWEAFRRSNADFSATIDTCAQLVANPGRFDNHCEDAWKDLRLSLRRCSRSDADTDQSKVSLASVPCKVHVWSFTLLVGQKCRFFRNQAKEMVQLLQSSEPWMNAISDNSDLLRAKRQLMGEKE
jgi:hypothetical protein